MCVQISEGLNLRITCATLNNPMIHLRGEKKDAERERERTREKEIKRERKKDGGERRQTKWERGEKGRKRWRKRLSCSRLREARSISSARILSPHSTFRTAGDVEPANVNSSPGNRIFLARMRLAPTLQPAADSLL